MLKGFVQSSSISLDESIEFKQKKKEKENKGWTYKVNKHEEEVHLVEVIKKLFHVKYHNKEHWSIVSKYTTFVHNFWLKNNVFLW